MQGSWQQLKSDSISWRKTLKSFHNSQSQWHVVSTFWQEMRNHLNPKGWIRMNTKIGPVLEVTTSYLQDEYGVEIRIAFLNKDNSHSWVRIFMSRISWSRTWATRRTTTRSRKLLRWSSKDLHWRWMYLRFASWSKAKARPWSRTSACSSTRTEPICVRSWTDIEPETYSPIAYPVSKRLSTLLRHGDLHGEDDGAIEFWILKDYLRNDFVRSQLWSDEKWKSTVAKGGGNKKRSIRRNSLSPSSSRSFRTQSHWSFITGHCFSILNNFYE